VIHQIAGVTLDTQPISAINLDLWKELYASRAGNLSASEVRALFAVVSRPEVVSLAGGMPDVSALSKATIQSAFDSLMQTQPELALQYGGGQGDLRLREQITELLALEGIAGSAADITITTGSQHGLDLVADLFLDPGDAVLLDTPSYVGAVGIFRHKEARLIHVESDADGIIPASLSESIRLAKASGLRTKMLYLVPNFANPTGRVLSATRRAEILEICAANQVLVVEDNPYGLIYFDEPPPQAMRTADENVVYLGSFSKILSPGLRVGYVLAPPAIRQKLVLANESALLSPPTFAQKMISEYLSLSDWQQQIATYRNLYRAKRDVTASAISELLPLLPFETPGGGFFIWLQLPQGLDSKEMLPLAVNELVAYTPGTAFYGDGRGSRQMRICFSHPPLERLRVGVERLARVINAQIELREELGLVE
jgi:DNA-binding transcriptional MocR family regulator